ncbi:MAG: hypothetical protein AAF367_13020 [Pseudomonadota bacterium]
MIDALKWRYRLAEARSLLEAERLIILNGPISDIAKLDARRDRVEGYLSELPETLSDQMRGAIEDLSQRAHDNQRLLKAYLDGAKMAADRLVKMAEVQENLGAYRQDGSRVTAPSKSGAQQHRF